MQIFKCVQSAGHRLQPWHAGLVQYGVQACTVTVAKLHLPIYRESGVAQRHASNKDGVSAVLCNL